MESSFLTFSPQALMRKKVSSKGVSVSQRLKIAKVKTHPLKIVDSPSSLFNIEKNKKVLSEASILVLDDSSLLHGNGKKQDRKLSYKAKTVHECKDKCSENELSISMKKKHDTIVLEDSTSNDKFNEIKLWLEELQYVHQQKSLSPVWSTPYVRNCGTLNSSESSSSKVNSLKLRVSETSTDVSVQFICATSTPLPHSNVKGCEDIPRRLDRVSESSEESIRPFFHRKLRILNSDSESSYDGQSLQSEETSRKSSHKLSTSPVLLSEQHSDGSNNKCNNEGRVIISESEGSKGSTDRLITELYGKTQEKKNDPPRHKVQNSFMGSKEATRSSVHSVDELLTHLYGDNWSREKVLTPLLHKKKKREAKGKENTPPLKDTQLSKANKPLRTFRAVDSPLNSAGDQKTAKSTKGTKVTDDGKQKEILSFLRSLSASPPAKLCHSRALIYKKEFKKNKEALCSELFKLFNAEVFKNQLPLDMKIDWNIRMNRTAGFCYNSWKMRPEGRVRSSRIELSTKVCSSADRVRDTLLHELCHAATWIVDGIKNGHGMEWKAWTRKAVKIFPELPRVGRCHNYDIQTKYTYKCKSCGYSIGRHSKSLDMQRKRCGYCYGEFELLVNTKNKKAETGITSTPRTPRAASGFALYVKENYKIVKEKNSCLKHAEIMKLLGNQFSAMKVASNP